MNKFFKPGDSEQPAKRPKKENFIQKAVEARGERRREAMEADTVPELRGNLKNVVQLFDKVKESNNIKDEIQQLVFAETLPKKPYRIIEVTKKMAEEFRKGQKLIFRGGQDDNAVLCTDDRTYDVKDVETSNSIFLVPSLPHPSKLAETGEKTLATREVEMLTHNFYELKEMECVSVYRLREMLHESELMWDWQKQATSSEHCYTWDGLLDVIRMSEKQLREALKAMPVVEHDGCLRWLSYDFRDKFFEELADLADDEKRPGVRNDNVDPSALSRHLSKNACPGALRWYLDNFCELLGEEPQEESQKRYKMLPRPIVRERASYLLRNVSSLDIETFERHLDQLLPVGITLDYSYLDGIHVITENMKGRFISYLNVEDLPENPRERLKILFERKSTWTMDEVTPYLSDICSNSKAISGMMVAHCRASKGAAGEKVFCSLRPV